LSVRGFEDSILFSKLAIKFQYKFLGHATRQGVKTDINYGGGNKEDCLKVWQYFSPRYFKSKQATTGELGA